MTHNDATCELCINASDARLVALSQAILRATDTYTAHHQERVAKLCVMLVNHLGYDKKFCQTVYYAALVHDLGKIAVPLNLLNKPSRLSNIEQELIRTHVIQSVKILESVGFDDSVVSTIIGHHERLDGSGYPNGLIGDAISAETRVLTVIDVFESMTSHRPYRAGLGVDAALRELHGGIDTKYDKRVVLALDELVKTSNDFQRLYEEVEWK
jgi:putative nucleotidyltransferase with HDIG domain